MADTIPVTCPECDKSMQVPAKLAGKKIRCKGCETTITVPAPKAAKTAKPAKAVEAPKGAPNILLFLTDDVGFGASSPFGGPIQTPNFQRLADSGLRYNTFHTTALCSPTRAALLIGRDQHTAHQGIIMERTWAIRVTIR